MTRAAAIHFRSSLKSDFSGFSDLKGSSGFNVGLSYFVVRGEIRFRTDLVFLDNEVPQAKRDLFIGK